MYYASLMREVQTLENAVRNYLNLAPFEVVIDFKDIIFQTHGHVFEYYGFGLRYIINMLLD
jgi:hypothetical protein